MTTLLATAPLWIGCGKDSPSSSTPADEVERAGEVKETPPAPPPAVTPEDKILAAIEEKNRGKRPSPVNPQMAASVVNGMKAGVMGQKIADTDGYLVYLSESAGTSAGRVGDYGDTYAAVDAKDGWHLDDKTPPRLTIAAPDGVTLDKSR